MTVGPIALFDNSALKSLSLTPPFLVETSQTSTRTSPTTCARDGAANTTRGRTNG